MALDLSIIRNIGVAAHIDAGKTTTTERILFYARRTHRMGDVDDGTTTTDFDEQEQTRGITIYSAAVTFAWRGHTINLIDTPGHVDFTAEVERSLRVLDGMVAVFDAREGVEAQSETVWRQADRYHVPRVCFINKMDRIGADFEHSVESIRKRLGARVVPLQIPIGASDSFVGLIDLIEQRAVYYQAGELGATFEEREIPGELAEAAESARHDLIEAACEFSETLMESYVSEKPPDPAELRKALRRGTLERKLFPVLCGSSLRYIGVQRLLDAVCDYLPGPREVPPVKGVLGGPRGGGEIDVHCDAKAPLAALIFKIIAEKPVDLYFVRVYRGTLKPNMRLLNPTTGEKENVSRLFRMFAKRRDQLDEAVAGDIVAIIGPKDALTGHTLCDAKHPVILESIRFPETVISVSVEPRSSRDRDKLMESLRALMRQDPTLTVTANEETGQTLVSGMGELHLEVVTHRLRNDLNVDVVVGKPRVSYRETVRQAGEGEGRFIRQIGGRNHFAVLRVRLSPTEPGVPPTGSRIHCPLSAEQFLPEFVKAAETGVTEAAQSGILGGYPVIDWRAEIVSVQQHDTDSSEIAFENAARLAFYEAMKSANAVLLEPIMDVEVVTVDEYFGAIISDLNARGGTVRESLMRGPERVILASVPLSQMFGYITRLRSLSQGRATASMEPSHYAPVSASDMKAMVG
ncbi:MAG: elongation factor G [Planctomycetota bacterium]